MPGGGRLIVETTNRRLKDEFIKSTGAVRKGHYVVLSITDTGIGMSDTTQEHIFEPFFSTKTETGGTGMGLAVVYGIVKYHEGIITVDSQGGEGTTFTLYFPARKKIETEKASAPKAVKSGGKRNILLVDDERLVLEMWGDFLSSQGFEVITAQGGDEAISLFRSRRDEIDLVILDYIMPRMNGKEVLVRLKKIDPAVKILFCSGYSEDGKAKEIITEGAEGFIQKPAQLSDLHRKIREILGDESP
jgi:CheY-like chemotaxis protein